MCFRSGEPSVWTPELIQQLKKVYNKIYCAVDYWLYSILGGYIPEFVVDTFKSYNAIEREFFIVI